MPAPPGTSSLLVDEYFSSQDPRFLDAVRGLRDVAGLIALAERWKKDPRPWARQQLAEYLAKPLDRHLHQPLVKRIFKHVEGARDHEAMGLFMRAFDRLVRRVRTTSRRWDAASRGVVRFERLALLNDTMPGTPPPQGPKQYRVNPITGRRTEILPKGSRALRPPAPLGRLFSYNTRYHLRRRAWRYFRRLGYQKPDEYVPAIARALGEYLDTDLARGENILDCWGLVQALFRKHPALVFRVARVDLAPGRSLSELSPAPKFLELWKDAGAAPVLLGMVATARARLVRTWATRVLREHHATRLAGLEASELRRLLDHPDPEVQRFGAELIGAARDLDTLSVATWLALLGTRNVDALELLCAAWRKHVRPERLELAQALDLACAASAPVARLGLQMLAGRTIPAEQRRMLMRLADTECPALAAELAAFALERGCEPYDREVASAVFDSLHRSAREAGWSWLADGKSAAAYADGELWARLVESPYDDVRLGLIDLLAERAKPGSAAAPPAATDDLAPVWSACLLAVHRGGRQKGKAIAQVRAALLARPEKAEALLPALAVAIRSVRGTEARAGLAAVVWAVEARRELEPLVARLLPELDLGGER